MNDQEHDVMARKTNAKNCYIHWVVSRQYDNI